MAERTLPTSPGGIVGLSPIDGYLANSERPVAYFEHNVLETLNAAMTTVEVVTNCNIVALGMVQGLNVTINLGSSSYRGATACGIYAEINMGSVSQSVSGRTSVMEARLDITALTGTYPGYTSCLCLDFSNTLAGYPVTAGGGCSYIALRERSAAARRVQSIFEFMDITPSAAANNKLFCASTTANHSHKLKFYASGVPYWICCSATAPD